MPHLLTTPLGNNVFSYDQRRLLWSDTTLVIPPPCKITTLSEVRLGHDVVFEEIDHHGKLQSCTGLAHTYVLNSHSASFPTIVITDNHNHVLPYWLEYLSTSDTSQSKLVHIDQHSDLWSNHNQINQSKLDDSQYTRDFTHLNCNIGNFITPCIQSWIISEMVQIRTEYTLSEIANLLKSSDKIFWHHMILDIDLDFWAPQMWIIDIEQTMTQVRILMDQADMITIATSPYFIDQQLAIDLLHLLVWPWLQSIGNLNPRKRI